LKQRGAVIIEIERKYYLITASHVIAQAVSVDTPFIIGVNCKYISVSGEFVCSEEPNTDNFDIAYIQLDPQFIDKNNIKPLESKRLLLRKILSPCHIAFIHGFPNSKNKPKKAFWNTNYFKVKAYAYAGIIQNNFTNWDTFGKIKEINTCMSYRKTSNNNTPTHPQGLSGGGLWVVPNISNLDEYYLDSILIEYHKNDSIVFSTKIIQVISFIKETSVIGNKKCAVILPL
jgi:hypothetical protein